MKALVKTRDILCLVASRPGVGLPQLSRSLGMPKSTTHRIMKKLVSLGFVEAGPKNRGYTIGPLIDFLTRGANHRDKLLAIARPCMVALRDACDETVALHVLEAKSWVAIDQVESTQELRRTITNMGTPMPLHAAATGKLFLAYMSEAERNRYLEEHELRSFTPHTLTSRRRLLEAVQDIRRNGYAHSFQEMAIGVAGVSMPIRRPDGLVTAALGVSGPIGRFTPRAIQSIRQALKTATRRIEAQLGAAEPSGADDVRRSDLKNELKHERVDPLPRRSARN